MKRLVVVFGILSFVVARTVAQSGQTQVSTPAGSYENGSTWLGGSPVTWGPTGVSINGGDPWRPPQGAGEIEFVYNKANYTRFGTLSNQRLMVLTSTGKIFCQYWHFSTSSPGFNDGPMSLCDSLPNLDSATIKKFFGDDLYILTSKKLYVQPSNSVTWTVDAEPPNVTAIYDMAMDTEQNVYIATDKGVYRQTPGSSTWGSGLAPAALSVDTTIYFDPRDRLYVADGMGHIFQSTNHGLSWKDISLQSAGTPEMVELQGDIQDDLFAVTHPVGYGFNFTQTLWRRMPGGGGWQQLTLPANTGEVVTINSMSADSSLMIATNFGAFISTDKGSTWTHVVNDLPAQKFGGIAVMPDGTLTTATETGVFYTTKDGISHPDDWNPAKLGGRNYTSGVILGRATDGSILSAIPSQFPDAMMRFYRSTDGKAWTVIDSFSNLPGQLSSIYRDESNTLYAATSFGLWKHAAGSLWSADTAGMQLAPGFFNNGSVVDVISDGHNLYATVRRGAAPIMRRLLSADTWTSDVDGLTGLSGRAGVIRGLDKSHRLFASVGRSILHRETSGWVVDHTPPNLSATDGSIDFSFDSSGAIFASFDTSGVYYSTDNANTWHATWLTNDHIPQAGAYSYEGASGVYLASAPNGNTYATTNAYGIYILKPEQDAGLLYDTTTLVFDTIPSGILTTEFVVANNGNANLVISNITSSDPHFSASTQFLSDPILPGDSRTINLSFTSSSAGTYSTTFTFNSNATLGFNTLHAVATSSETGGVEPATAEEKIHIIPNPAYSTVMITSGSTGDITITDLLGRIVYHTNVEGITRLDVQDFPSGLYHVMVVSKGKSSVTTLSVIH